MCHLMEQRLDVVGPGVEGDQLAALGGEARLLARAVHLVGRLTLGGLIARVYIELEPELFNLQIVFVSTMLSSYDV